MRKNLKVFRVQHNLTQDEMSQKIGCTRATYSSIETGKREGRKAFWMDLKKAFNIPDADMWSLQQDE